MKVMEIWRAIEPYALGLIHRSTARGCRVYSSVTQTIPTGTATPLTFDTELHDTDACWAVGDPTKLYAARDGYYIAGGGWTLANTQNTAAGRVTVSVRANGTVIHGTGEVHTIANKFIVCTVSTGMIWLAAGDYIEICAYHEQGADRTAYAATASAPALCGAWLMRVG